MAMPQAGLELVLEDKGFQEGLAKCIKAMSNFEDKTEEVSQTSERARSPLVGIGNALRDVVTTGAGVAGAALEAFATAATVGMATAVAAIGGFVTVSKMGLDATLAWGEQLDQLGDLFGMAGPEASQFAVALNGVGVSVEEGSGAFNYFIRSLNSAQDGMKQGAETFGASAREVSDSFTTAMAEIEDKWTQTQQDAADKTAEIWQKFADDRASIEADLNQKLADMDEDFRERYEKSVKDANKSAAKQTKDATKDEAKSLAKLQKDEQKELAKATTEEERNEIRARYAERRQEIKDQANERRAEIEEARQERLAEIEEEKQEAAQQLERDKARARVQADARIEEARRAAQKQAEEVEKGLEREKKAHEKAEEEQQKRFAEQMKKLKEALGKTSQANPMLKALKDLGIRFDELVGPNGKIKPFNEIMPKVIDAFKHLPAGVDASATAMLLFGRQGGKFLDFLRGAAGSIEDARQKMKDWGLEMSTAEVDAIEQFGFAVEQTKLQLQGIWNEIGRNVLPYARALVDFINNNILPAFHAWEVENLPKLISALQNFGQFIQKDVIPVFNEIVKAVQTGDFGKLADTVGTILKGVVEEAGKRAKELVDKVADYLDKHWSDISKELEKWAGQFWNWVGTALRTVTTEMAKLTTAIRNWVSDNKTELGDLGRSVGKHIVDGIAALFETEGKKGKESSIAKNLGQMLRDINISLVDVFADVGAGIATGIVDGMVKKFPNISLSEEQKRIIADAFKTFFTSALNAPTLINGLIDYVYRLLCKIVDKALQLWRQYDEEELDRMVRELMQEMEDENNASPYDQQTQGRRSGMQGLMATTSGASYITNNSYATYSTSYGAPVAAAGRGLTVNINAPVYGVNDLIGTINRAIDRYDRT